jgi:hypothetical protein
MAEQTAPGTSKAGSHLSALFSSLVSDPSAPATISIGEIIETLQDRMLPAMIFLFSAPTALPMPPGFSTITAVPLIFLTGQLMLGIPPWLPEFVKKRTFRRADLKTIVDGAEPWLKRAESIMRPRFALLANRERVVGLIALILALVLLLPIPGGNFPPSVALCLMCLGLIERDGLWIGVGILASVVAVAIAVGVVWAVVTGGSSLFGWLF